MGRRVGKGGGKGLKPLKEKQVLRSKEMCKLRPKKSFYL